MNAARRRGRAPAAKPPAATVRVYRQGIGDCILVTLRRKNGDPFHILIDCGVMMVTSGKREKLGKVLGDVAKVTGGEVDVLVVTHEHYDHVAGFGLASEAFGKLKIGTVWTAWTEDPHDPLARKLRGETEAAFNLLAETARALRAAGAGDEERRLMAAAAGADPASKPEIAGVPADNVFAAVRVSTASALAAAFDSIKPSDPDYLHPHTLAPLPADVEANVFVLGPPRDEEKLNRSDPDPSHPETFGLADALAAAAAEANLGAHGLSGGFPFSDLLKIPLDDAKSMPFFRQHYFDGFSEKDLKSQREAAREAASADRPDTRPDPVIDVQDCDVGWRRIESAAFARAHELALHLEKHTNNTSLALAIELPSGDVLLFPGDAQVGNSLSWHDADFTDAARKVTTEELLGRTVFYKVSHHGSHNGTLEEKGLAMMRRLRFAAITVSEVDARKLGWDRMPLDELVGNLQQRVASNGGLLVRADVDADHEEVTRDPDFYEFTFN